MKEKEKHVIGRLSPKLMKRLQEVHVDLSGQADILRCVVINFRQLMEKEVNQSLSRMRAANLAFWDEVRQEMCLPPDLLLRVDDEGTVYCCEGLDPEEEETWGLESPAPLDVLYSLFGGDHNDDEEDD